MEQPGPDNSPRPRKPAPPPPRRRGVSPSEIEIDTSGGAGKKKRAAPAAVDAGVVDIVTAPPSETREPTEEPQEEKAKARLNIFAEIRGLALDNSPPWLISAVTHMCVLVLLALIIIPLLPNDQIDLVAYSEKLGPQSELEFDTPFTTEDDPQEKLQLALNELFVDDPLAELPQMNEIVPNAMNAVSPSEPLAIGFALDGRNPGARESLVRAYGGTGTTEEAVQRALEWLARNQRRDGSWSLVGPYSDGAKTAAGAPSENKIAATAMAILAFQGHGDTTETGDYQQNLTRAWNWLLDQQAADGCFINADIGYNAWFYTQAQATIAVCEAHAMTKVDLKLKERFRESAQKAIDYCVRSQSPLGGWKYAPQQNSDVSVTGWVVMALQSARMGGLEVPKHTLQGVDRFLNNVAQSDGSRYPYEQGQAASRSMTAEGLLMREYLGWRGDDPRLLKGLDWLIEEENLVSMEKGQRDVYYWYYATQALHHVGGERWLAWNRVMRQKIPETQVLTGREIGSWDPMKPSRDAYGDLGGRLYVTCLSVYILEVYYRHMPLYYDPFAHAGQASSLDIPDSP